MTNSSIIERLIKLTLVLVVLMTLAPVRRIEAQEYPQFDTNINVSAGVIQFDLSGTGTAPAIAVRFPFPLTSSLLLETGVLAARLDQQFDLTTTLVIPEVALQIQVPRRFAPFVGLGVGAAIDFRPRSRGDAQASITSSAALGARYGISRRMGAIAELRVRGIGIGLSGSTAEWTGGLLWRI